MITNRMKEQLITLGYSAKDIASLQPERAAAIIDREIRRPSQGMPENWSRAGPGRKGILGKTFTVVKQAATIALATSLALHFTGTDLGAFSDLVDEVARTLHESTKSRR